MEAASHSIKKLKICIKKFSPTSQTLLCSMAPKALIVIWYFACQVKLLILKCSFVVLSCTAAVQTEVPHSHTYHKETGSNEKLL